MHKAVKLFMLALLRRTSFSPFLPTSMVYILTIITHTNRFHFMFEPLCTALQGPASHTCLSLNLRVVLLKLFRTLKHTRQ